MGRQWSSGTSRPGWDRAGPAARLPAVKRKLNVSRPAGSRYATNEQVPRMAAPEKMLHTDSARVLRAIRGGRYAYRSSSSAYRGYVMGRFGVAWSFIPLDRTAHGSGLLDHRLLAKGLRARREGVESRPTRLRVPSGT